MLSLDRLPNEVLHGIASCLAKKYDLAALSRVNRHCYQIASPILWKREKTSDRPGAIHWAVEHEDINVLNKALDAGVNPCRLAFLHKPKPRIDPKYKWWNYHSSYYDDPAWSFDDDNASVDLDPTFVFHETCTCFSGDGCCDSGIYEDCLWEPLHIAAAKGNIDMIEKLLDKGANINAGSWGYCLCQPHLPIEAFSESRAVGFRELEEIHGAGWTPLHVAICHSQVETAKFLLRRGALTNVYPGIDLEIVPLNPGEQDLLPDPESFKLTALHNAATYDQPELIKFILDEKYQDKVDVSGPYMGTPLIQAIWYGYWDTVVPLLIEYGAEIDYRLPETRLTCLMMACFSRRFDDAAKLVDLGANVKALSVHRFSILHLVLGPGHMDDDELYSDGGELEKTTPKKNTITEAELIRKFIEKGFPVDTRENLMGMTPLMVASASCNVDAMKILLEGGADVNALDHDGLTALARVGEAADGPEIAFLLEAGRLLLDAGATLDDSRDELTALNIICARQNEERYNTKEWADQHAKLAQLFIERGADPNDKGVCPRSPFIEAVLHSNFTLAQALLDSGGRPDDNDIVNTLISTSKETYDEGKMEFLMNLDFGKYDLRRPDDEFFLDLAERALSGRLWSRVADIIRVVPCPKEMRKCLMHRCLIQGTRNEDDPSSLVQALIELGEDPDELYEGEPAIYYSLKSPYCWRSTPLLVKSGADVRMATPKMRDGAFMHAVRQGYQGQIVQILAKHPDIMKDQSEESHIECWESIVCHGTHSRPGSSRRGDPLNLPYIHWNTAKKLLEAGLKTDLDLPNGTDVKTAVELSAPAIRSLGKVEREVLTYFGYETEEDLELLRLQQKERCYLDSYDDDDEDGSMMDGWDDEVESDEEGWEYDYEGHDLDEEDDSEDDSEDDDSEGGYGVGMPHMFFSSFFS